MIKAKLTAPDLSDLNLNAATVYYQLSPAELIEAALKRNEGTLADSGALAIDTGMFTGRSPKDRFIVSDDLTRDLVWWSDINIPFDGEKADRLFDRLIDYLENKPVFVRDAFACADPAYRLGIRVITETAYQNLFAYNLFLRAEEGKPADPSWTIVAAPGFLADPERDGTRQANFSIIDFTKKRIMIGGTGYTGEIKKGVFSVLNFLLPVEHQVLPMHCSANTGQNGDTALFFGLSGTGKTTLSADSERALVGDDEHGWSDQHVFNFEGGCYAKCVNLSAENEPEIFNAIRFGALLENTNYFSGSREVDFSDISKTENTRVAYPIHYISNAAKPSVAPLPKHIFFLTADAFGVLPPISRLDARQAMFHFISGYTAKVAGTEAGVLEPQATFSACYGKAFLPLHPVTYANLLGQKMEQHEVSAWLINTGWSGGPYGTGSRIKLSYTRAMIRAAMKGALAEVDFNIHPVFGLQVPAICPGVPTTLLDPAGTWTDGAAYTHKARELADAFVNNFRQFEDAADTGLLQALREPAAQ
ncbi:phosphoenolpyruvate carboxykinase (ATP) [Pedobacter yulinensis]|uniref:Phosphoenolpyruvate carboxykinase (ATP) n=1 Tax=Pedobacter yulinensis TaxID=2126353 RepID=A0A2T3HQZ5_9SPHI|nr:phosphoenolpyruvate carboxykinase (ATP) [Pedobacter yulinensis]PST84821.1 phosphoenolpyruvate carboxykinase (ATP) [Pedobacter yulinensis]